MPTYKNLINKDIISDIDFYKRVLKDMPIDERLDWYNVDLGDNINYHIQVWFNEDKWPHFHIISDDGTFETALSFLEPTYYIHKEGIQYLSCNQIDKLFDYLNEKPDGYYTRWNVICEYWRDFNINRKYDFDYNFADNNANLIPIPNYNILKYNQNKRIAQVFYKEN